MTNMQPTHLGTALTLGVVIHHVASIAIFSKSSDCLATIDSCMSDLCRNEQAFYSGTCDDEGCQIKSPAVCNMTVSATLDQFPSLGRCMCVWAEEELCLALQTLTTTQCPQKPALQKRSASRMDWRASNLVGFVFNRAGSCLEQMTVCIHDEICNRNLVPLIQACTTEQCNNTNCRLTTQEFYSDMPGNIAEMLVMCECEPWDKDCLQIKSNLHSGTCGDEIWTCQEGVNHCLQDLNCRNRLKVLISKCWNAENTPCGEEDYTNTECISQMNPALILGGDPGCRVAFLAIMGTPLQYPCTCVGLNANNRQRCNTLSDILHNRSHFAVPRQKLNDSYKTSEIKESPRDHPLVTDHLPYVLVYVALVVVVLLVTSVIFYKSGMLKRTGQTQFHTPGKMC